MKTFNIAALAGDGIGPEVMREAIKVLRATEKKFGFTLNITEAPVGWAGIDAAGKSFDPNFHEAVGAEEGGTALEEIRRGWMIGDRVLRPSAVRIVKPTAGSGSGSGTG